MLTQKDQHYASVNIILEHTELIMYIMELLTSTMGRLLHSVSRTFIIYKKDLIIIKINIKFSTEQGNYKFISQPFYKKKTLIL